MDYHHRFIVDAPLASVQSFHRSADSLRAITPSLFLLRNLQAPDTLDNGDELSFTIQLGPLPVRWTARVENVDPSGFDDVQLEGPFADWVHAHRFEALDEARTLVHDHVRLRLRVHPLWGPAGVLMALGLPLLFAFRGRKTKSLLERKF